MKINKIKVPININKLPVAMFGAGILKVAAIKNLRSIEFTESNRSFMYFAISIICQSNGYLSQWIIPKPLLINLFLGHGSYIDLIPNVINMKKEYYSFVISHHNMKKEYYNSVISHHNYIKNQSKLNLYIEKIKNLKNKIKKSIQFK